MKISIKKISYNISYVKIILISLLILFTLVLFSCNKQIETTEEIEQSAESIVEETTIDMNSLSDEDEARILYSPSPYFHKSGIREKQDVFCFAGDIIMSRRPREAYDKDGIDEVVDKGIQQLFKDSDFNVANLETVITDNTHESDDKEWTFALPSKYVKAIKDAGVNLLTLANNHILDFGVDALLDTIEILDKNDLPHIGAGENEKAARRVYIKEIEGKRYAFLGTSAVIPKDVWKATSDRAGVYNAIDTFAICEHIRRLKPYVDKVIVYVHWGNELEENANDSQKRVGRYFVDAGADLVIGTHAHIVQEIEYYKGVPIIYSLGNFIYGGTKRDMIILKATFDYSKSEIGELKIKIYPGVANYKKASRYYDENFLSDFFTDLESRSRDCMIDMLGNVTEKNNEDEIAP